MGKINIEKIQIVLGDGFASQRPAQRFISFHFQNRGFGGRKVRLIKVGKTIVYNSIEDILNKLDEVLEKEGHLTKETVLDVRDLPKDEGNQIIEYLDEIRKNRGKKKPYDFSVLLWLDNSARFAKKSLL